MDDGLRQAREAAMSRAELDAFLVARRTCRVATEGPQGTCLTALRYVWDGSALWLSTVTEAELWNGLRHGAVVVVLVDTGEERGEPRGAELRGSLEVFGEGQLSSLRATLRDEAARLFGLKYGGDATGRDGRHVWMRVVPAKISCWNLQADAEEPEQAVAREGEAPPPILELLDLEDLEKDLFRAGAVFNEPFRLFGGQVAAQALLAAGRTVPEDRLPHSLHGYFLRSGSAVRPTIFQVHRDRDGNSFSARRVVAVQDGQVVFNMAASFATERSGVDLDAEPAPALPDPGLLPGWLHPRHPSFEFRSSTEHRLPTKFWIRCTAELPDDPLLHAAVLTYTSDISSGLIALRPEGGWSGASVDHAVWFHRPFRMNTWTWLDLVPHIVAGGRGLYSGAVYSAEGSRVASTTQEGLYRERGGNAA